MYWGLLVPLLLATDPAAPADPPVFVIDSTRDEQPAGPLVRLAADGTAQVGGTRPVSGVEIIALRRQGLPPPHYPHDRPYARLANGDRIPGRLLSIIDDKARFLADLGSSQEITIPLSALAALWLTDAAAAETPAGRRVLAEKRRQDVAQLTNGDLAAGTVVGWAPDGPLRIDAAGRPVALPRERVQALMLSTDLARAAKPRSAYRQIVLLNGARLSVRTAELVGDEIRATMSAGAAAHIPLRAVAAINIYQGPAVYLSDRSYLRYEPVRYLGISWPVTTDHGVAGGDMRLGGGTYDKGIGLHGPCSVTYAVPAGARRFETVVGLDEQTGRLGNVRIQISADGKPILDTPLELTGTDPPKPLRLALPPGTRELCLAVEVGRGGDVQDHVDWADARVIVGRAAGP